MMKDMEPKDKKYPEGHFVGMCMLIGLTIGAGIGIPLGIIIGNPGLFGIGLPIGLALGLAIGSSIEAKYKKEGKINPLTEDEKKKREILVIAGISVFILGLLIFLLGWFL